MQPYVIEADRDVPFSPGQISGGIGEPQRSYQSGTDLRGKRESGHSHQSGTDFSEQRELRLSYQSGADISGQRETTTLPSVRDRSQGRATPRRSHQSRTDLRPQGYEDISISPGQISAGRGNQDIPISPGQVSGQRGTRTFPSVRDRSQGRGEPGHSHQSGKGLRAEGNQDIPTSPGQISGNRGGG